MELSGSDFGPLGKITARYTLAGESREFRPPAEPDILDFPGHRFIPLDLELPQSLKEDLHTDSCGSKPSQNIEGFCNIRDQNSLCDYVSSAEFRNGQMEVIKIRVPFYSQGLGIFHWIWDEVQGV